MEITVLKKRSDLKANTSVSKYYLQFVHFIDLIREKQLSEPVVQSINTHIDKINAIEDSDKKLKAELRKNQNELLKLLIKENNLVTKNYYRNTWMMIGMGAIGVPIGTSFGVLTKNMGLIAIGLPFGMIVGLLVGLKLDRKAAHAGNQLDIEIKY
ncbi:MAG: hypothetical protein DWP98_09170 [Bacteroidetes bacterium]|nr:MAG: hypothetical protein DWP98_09170 [Bacteroidota bacterium]MBL1144097.1 hypothetical protein [Bacteroidota bacterium]NOG56892.1 hypothetical protein [Bacteroidota bacterium]